MRRLRSLPLPLVALVVAGFVATAAATLTSTRAAGGDRVVLKSGRELVGRFEGERDHRLYFLDDEIGRVAVTRRNVRTIVRADLEPGLFAPVVLEADAEPAPRNWVRFEPPRAGRPGRLSTGVGRFFDERTRTTVFLVGAVHIGEPAYYARLQDLLDGCDVVLFEGVGSGGAAADDKDQAGPADRAARAEQLASMDALTKLQLTLQRALGLQFQHDGLDYSRDFWKNADVDFQSLSRRMAAEGVGLPTDSPIFRALLQFVIGAFDLSKAAENPAMRRSLRRQAAAAIATSDQLFGGALHKLGAVLVDWRNDAALAVLDDELATGRKGRWIAIFFGAAHLPDLATKLLKRGFEYQRSDWIEAWTVE